MPNIHARFSPSAANRRIHCPPSLLLEEQFEEGESVYAAEGTAGHAMAEHLLHKYLKQRTKRPTSEFYTDELLEAVDEYSDRAHRDGGHHFGAHRGSGHPDGPHRRRADHCRTNCRRHHAIPEARV